MSNAAGRLVGTLLSGFLFQSFNGGMTGLIACLLGALVLAGISALFVSLWRGLRASERDLKQRRDHFVTTNSDCHTFDTTRALKSHACATKPEPIIKPGPNL